MEQVLSDISGFQTAPERDPRELHYVYFGGGGGTSAIAKEVAEGLQGDITFVIAMSDSGGSVKKYRDEVGGVGLSDVAKTMYALGQNEAVMAAVGDDDRCAADTTLDNIAQRNESLFAALSDTLPSDQFDQQQARGILAEAVELSRDIITHHDDLGRIAYGSLLLGGAKRYFERNETGDLTTAIDTMSRWLGVADNVHILPAVVEAHDLMMEHVVDGQVRTVATEGEIDDTPIQHPDSVHVWLHGHSGNAPRAPQAVLDAIKHADHAIFGPGSPITSIIASLAGEGVQEELEALVDRGGNVFMVANLVPEKTMPSLAIEQVEHMIGRHAVGPTHSVYNNGGVGEGLVPLQYRGVSRAKAEAIGAPLVGAVAEYGAADVVAAQGLRTPRKTNGKRVAQVILTRTVAAA